MASAIFVIDCCTRESLDWPMPRIAARVLEQALITRWNSLDKAPASLVLRSDNGLVFTSKYYTRIAREHGVRQEFITPRTPQQNGLIERFIRTFKQQCGHKGNFRSLAQAQADIERWLGFYNRTKPSTCKRHDRRLH